MSDERKHTYELISIGMKLACKDISIPESVIDEWMAGDKDAPFPSIKKNIDYKWKKMQK